jgi:hypothetical protein
MIYKTRKANRTKINNKKYYGGSIDQPYEHYEEHPFVYEEQPLDDGNNSLALNIIKKGISIALQLVVNGLNMVIDNISNLLGANPNQNDSESMSQLASQIEKLVHIIKNIIRVVLETQLGDELQGQVMEAAQKILTPAFNKVGSIFNNFIAKEEHAAVGLAANLAEDVAYPIVAPVRTILSTLDILNNSLIAFAEATGLLKDEIGTFHHIKDQIMGTISKIGEAAKTSGQMAQSQYLDPSQYQGQYPPQYPDPSQMPDPAQMPAQYPPQYPDPSQYPPQYPDPSQYPEPEQLQFGGAATRKLKQLHKDAIKIGGRIHQSRLNFLSPHLMSSKKRRRTRRKN